MKTDHIPARRKKVPAVGARAEREVMALLPERAGQEPTNIHSLFNACMYRAHCKRLESQASDAERWAKEANKLDDYVSAFGAACAVIDSHAGDPGLTAEMVRTYAEFQKWREHLKRHNVGAKLETTAPAQK